MSNTSMTHDLSAGRHAFTDAIRRQTLGTDQPRYVAVLDALLDWTNARAGRLVQRPTTRGESLRFARAGTQELFWSAHVTRDNVPRLEIHVAPGRARSAGDRADTMRTLNAHTRHLLEGDDRLTVGFGALKNAAALAAVLALMDRLLVEPAASA